MKRTGKNKENLEAVDFFCSGGGMTNGMTQAGVSVLAGIDIDITCKETYEKNNPNSKFIHADLFNLAEKDIEREINIKKNDDNLIFIGCSPCQYWSIIRTDKKRAEKTKNLLGEFQRFVEYFNPGYVVVENVPGIKHREKESGLSEFIASLEKNGYHVHSEIVNLNNFGVPQKRRRFSLIATRVNSKAVKPQPDKNNHPVVKDFIGEWNGFPKIEAGFIDKTNFDHTASKLNTKNLERIRQTPKNGGSWLDWKENEKLRRNTYTGNGFIDNYGRMVWDEPAPTITTKFHSLSNGRFGHPDENRALSLREGATLQTFPQSYMFFTNGIRATAKIIGNAVPPEYAKRIGKAIIQARKNND
jgi:DNA (cytosine-5)-methyltransferase 1